MKSNFRKKSYFRKKSNFKNSKINLNGGGRRSQLPRTRGRGGKIRTQFERKQERKQERRRKWRENRISRMKKRKELAEKKAKDAAAAKQKAEELEAMKQVQIEHGFESNVTYPINGVRVTPPGIRWKLTSDQKAQIDHQKSQQKQRENAFKENVVYPATQTPALTPKQNNIFKGHLDNFYTAQAYKHHRNWPENKNENEKDKSWLSSIRNWFLRSDQPSGTNRELTPEEQQWINYQYGSPNNNLGLKGKAANKAYKMAIGGQPSTNPYNGPHVHPQLHAFMPQPATLGITPQLL